MDRKTPKARANQPKDRAPQQNRTLNLALRNANSNRNNDQQRTVSNTKKGTVANRSTRNVLPTDKRGELVPGTHQTPVGTVCVRKIEPAKEYNVLSVARAMNPDLAKGVKELFDPELEAAQIAIDTGLYISWRPKLPPYDRQDCQRVGPNSRCFCGHLLRQHVKFTGIERVLKCEDFGCPCKAFRFVPSRPEEVGEFWLRRRRNFDAAAYRCNCCCKHTHEEHNIVTERCRVPGCGCSVFNSASVCAACDNHTQNHETVLETEKERRDTGRPIREDWLPFAEIATLKKMVLTGEDDGGSMNPAKLAGAEQAALPSNSAPFPRPRDH